MSARDDYPALAVLHDAWQGVGRVNMPEAIRAFREIERLRAECSAWMNAVADAVEPLGYDREAACGPADLLPGLADLAPRQRRLVNVMHTTDVYFDLRLEVIPIDTGDGLRCQLVVRYPDGSYDRSEGESFVDAWQGLGPKVADAVAEFVTGDDLTSDQDR